MEGVNDGRGNAFLGGSHWYARGWRRGNRYVGTCLFTNRADEMMILETLYRVLRYISTRRYLRGWLLEPVIRLNRWLLLRSVSYRNARAMVTMKDIRRLQPPKGARRIKPPKGAKEQ